ncbi:SDR family NAD(P)-dependent oxidoreductase [Streptomyces sp. MH60]|uniref:SDR family NAD(P)-dependent oxidoreductase n=1 Tax=Streptomyces sp. MH60 TaxID=1940758 RepID=UPI000D477898|nr:Dihydroanticapsin 7-dehydrogenase [Streptomyces sp. MH60]
MSGYARQTVGLIAEEGGRAEAVAVDIGDELSVRRAVTQVAATFGGPDFAVNNAGIPSTGHILTEMPVHEWERVLRVNLTGTWLRLKYELPVMKQDGGGAIVNVASNGGLYAIPGAPAYVASKHGVVGLSKVAAYEGQFKKQIARAELQRQLRRRIGEQAVQRMTADTD